MNTISAIKTCILHVTTLSEIENRIKIELKLYKDGNGDESDDDDDPTSSVRKLRYNTNLLLECGKDKYPAITVARPTAVVRWNGWQVCSVSFWC